MNLNDARPKNTQWGDFQKNLKFYIKVHEELWREFKEALERPTNMSKEEHIIITCLSAFISEISSDSAAVCS